MEETHTPIDLEISTSTFDAISNLATIDPGITQGFDYYIERISDGYLEKLIDKSVPVAEPVDGETNWFVTNVRQLPLRMAIAGPGNVQQLALQFVIGPLVEGRAPVLITSLELRDPVSDHDHH